MGLHLQSNRRGKLVTSDDQIFVLGRRVAESQPWRVPEKRNKEAVMTTKVSPSINRA